MALKTLSINDVDLSTFGIYLQSDTYLSAPSFDYVEYAVPARDGNLLSYNKRMNNIIRRFDCLIKDNVQSGLDALKNLIYSNAGYLKLATSYEPDVYQEGYLAQEIEVTPFTKDSALSAQFSLYFSCKPQKYFNEEGDGYLGRVEAIVPNLIAVYKRGDEALEEILSRVRPWEMPEAEYFLVFDLYAYEDSSDVVTFTDVSVSTSAGGFIGFTEYVGMNEEEASFQALYYGNDGEDSYPEIGGMEFYLHSTVIAPFNPNAVITGQLTHNGTVHSFTANMADYTVTITNDDAVGADVDSLAFGIRSSAMNYSGTGVDGYYMIEGRKSGEKRFSAVVKAPFGNLTAQQIQALEDKYPSELFTHTIVRYLIAVDNDLNARIKTTINAGELLEISGDISGICDEYLITMLKMNVADNKYVGQPLSVRAAIRWWKV